MVDIVAGKTPDNESANLVTV